MWIIHNMSELFSYLHPQIATTERDFAVPGHGSPPNLAGRTGTTHFLLPRQAWKNKTSSFGVRHLCFVAASWQNYSVWCNVYSFWSGRALHSLQWILTSLRGNFQGSSAQNLCSLQRGFHSLQIQYLQYVCLSGTGGALLDGCHVTRGKGKRTHWRYHRFL